jgi:hypothetical protein
MGDISPSPAIATVRSDETMLERLALVGFLAGYSGPTRESIEPFDMHTVFTDPDELKRLMTLVSSVAKESAICDTAVILELYAAQAEVADTKSARPDTACGAGSRSPRPVVSRSRRRCGLVPRRTDRHGGAGQPAPARWLHEGNGVRRQRRE